MTMPAIRYPSTEPKPRRANNGAATTAAARYTKAPVRKSSRCIAVLERAAEARGQHEPLGQMLARIEPLVAQPDEQLAIAFGAAAQGRLVEPAPRMHNERLEPTHAAEIRGLIEWREQAADGEPVTPLTVILVGRTAGRDRVQQELAVQPVAAGAVRPAFLEHD